MFGTDVIVNSVCRCEYKDVLFFPSARVSPAQQSRQYKTCEATQQELMKEALCDERAACCISKRQREETSCVLRESDVPLFALSEAVSLKESLTVSSVDFELGGKAVQ